MSRFVTACVVALGLSGCIGVSASRVAKDGTPLPPRYCPNGIVSAADGGLDDFEDGNTQLKQIAGRGGYWWKSADNAGSTIGPEDFRPVPTPDGTRALHAEGKTVTGSPEDAWGAQFGANFTQGGVYDASKYVGLRFRAKIGKGSAPNVRLKVSDINTHKDLGVCKSCWNHFGRDLSLTPEWQTYEVLFASMQQAPFWGDPRPGSITPTKIYSLDFSVGAGLTFDVWIDDLEFIACK